ncbi:MAG: response regulator transcription factor [Candidatus Rokubacteria bacterium]|nr:response regulator transcription factor [Candidatus Rokubacteria bacterium]
MKSTRILVVDDHALFRKGVATLLSDTEGFTVVGEARDGREAVAKAQTLAPDVVLMDIYMPNMDGLEATRRIKQAMPSTRVVVLTISEEDQNLFEALKAGAHGYLLKSVEPEELFRTLRGIVRGEAFFTPSMAAKLLGEFTRKEGAGPVAQELAAISPREREVLGLLTHLKSIMEKLHAENRVQVVAYALRKGLVKEPPP